MIEFSIPGRGILKLKHLVIDVEGTLSLDGRYDEKRSRQIQDLKDRLDIHLVTNDRSQQADWLVRRLGVTAFRVRPAQDDPEVRAGEAAQKAGYIRQIGADQAAAIGQGADDVEMLRAAALGICVLSPEGVAVPTLLAADLVVPDGASALDLFLKPVRIVSSLRS